MLDLEEGVRPPVQTLSDIFKNNMNLFNFDQKDMINSEDKIEYTLYAQNLMEH